VLIILCFYIILAKIDRLNGVKYSVYQLLNNVSLKVAHVQFQRHWRPYIPIANIKKLITGIQLITKTTYSLHGLYLDIKATKIKVVDLVSDTTVIIIYKVQI